MTNESQAAVHPDSQKQGSEGSAQNEESNKPFDLKFEGTTVVATIDPNKDGKPLAVFSLDLLQIPQEVKDLLK